MDRPRVTLKYAQTLDGRIATSTGHSRWISSPQSRALAHRLRAEHDAVLVGVGTVIADDPLLTVRLVEGKDPLRVVLDTRLRTPLTSRLLREEARRTVLAAGSSAPAENLSAVRGLGAEVVELPEIDGRVDLEALLRYLARSGIASLLVEGGAAVLTSVLRLRCADQIALFVAPLVVGAGIEAIGDLGITSVDEAVTVLRPSIESAGPDVVVRGELAWPGDEPSSA